MTKNHNLSRTRSHMPVFSTENHTINRMPVFLTKNHNLNRALAFSTQIAPSVIRMIFSIENAIESNTLQQFHNKTFRHSAN